MKGRKISATQWPAFYCLIVFGLALGILPVQAAQALSVDLVAQPQQIAPGDRATLRWSSSGARWCWAHGSWGGGRSLQGNETAHRQWNQRWYAITCTDGRNQVSDSVSVAVLDDAPTMSVSLNASPTEVERGGTTRLSWTSNGARWCWAHGSWGGGRSLQGNQTSHRQWGPRSYGITCSDGNREVTDSVVVAVSGAGGGGGGGEVPVVRWQPPTQNVDGSPLRDLAGYRFYWGSTSGNYHGSADVNNPNWTQYDPDHLAPGRYFVAVTAIDGEGNESDYSNEIQIEVL